MHDLRDYCTSIVRRLLQKKSPEHVMSPCHAYTVDYGHLMLMCYVAGEHQEARTTDMVHEIVNLCICHGWGMIQRGD